MPDLSIIIVSYNVRDYLLKCLASIQQHIAGVDYEVIVVDNDSSDGSADAVAAAFSNVMLVRSPSNLGFAKGNNLGYEKSSGGFVLLLNPDTEIKANAISETLSFMKKEPRAGIAACRIVGSDGKLQKSIHPFTTVLRNIAWALFIDRFLFPEHRKSHYYQSAPFSVDSVSGAFMLVRRSALGDGPLLNPDYFMYSEEKDLCLRLKRAGWDTWFVPGAEIIHYGGKSTSQMPLPMFLELQKSQVLFFRNFYAPLYALALCLSWWLVLCSNTALSLFLVYSRKGRGRFRLFGQAALFFPGFIIAQTRNHAAAHPRILHLNNTST
jgi:GT2 family glycosyltransferase